MARAALVGGLVALVGLLVTGNAAAGGGSGFGAVEVCKAPGAAVGGKQFAFSVGGQEVSLTASPTQTMCSQAVKVAAGTATVTEAAATGFKVTAVTAIPQAALVGSPDLDARRATVRVEAGEETLVVFTNAAVSSPLPPPPHTVELCKTGDVDAKASFSFAVTKGGTAVQGSPLTLSTGACTLVGAFSVGTELTVVETPAQGTAVAGVTAAPAAFLASADGATAHVRVVQTRSTVNVLTFENKRVGTSPDQGKQVPVKLCKAGTVPYGTSFSFAVSVAGSAVSGSPFTVSAGRCVRVGVFPIGTVLSITEASAPGTELAGVAAWPSPALLSVADRTATVRVTASGFLAGGPGTGAAFNLLQQTVAALLNLERGATASASVAAAIQTALAGLSVEFDGGRVADVSATKSALAALDTIVAVNADPATHCDSRSAEPARGAGDRPPRSTPRRWAGAFGTTSADRAAKVSSRQVRRPPWGRRRCRRRAPGP